MSGEKKTKVVYPFGTNFLKPFAVNVLMDSARQQTCESWLTDIVSTLQRWNIFA